LRYNYYVHAFRSAKAAGTMSSDDTMRREVGAPIERLAAGDLRDLEPDLSHDFQAATLLKGQAGATFSGRLGSALEAERCYHVSFADPGVRLSHSVMDMGMKFVASEVVAEIQTNC
jgi:hypothetical protein